MWHDLVAQREARDRQRSGHTSRGRRNGSSSPVQALRRPPPLGFVAMGRIGCVEVRREDIIGTIGLRGRVEPVVVGCVLLCVRQFAQVPRADARNSDFAVDLAEARSSVVTGIASG